MLLIAAEFDAYAKNDAAKMKEYETQQKYFIKNTTIFYKRTHEQNKACTDLFRQ